MFDDKWLNCSVAPSVTSAFCVSDRNFKGIFVAPMLMVSPEWKKKTAFAQGKSCDSLGILGKLYCLVLIMHHHILWQMLMCNTDRVCENGRTNYFITLGDHLSSDWLKEKLKECWCHKEARLAPDETCAEALNVKLHHPHLLDVCAQDWQRGSCR